MGARPARRACSMPSSTSADAAEAAAHLREHVRVERVEADGDAIEAGGLELGGVLGEQHAVGGERDVLDAGQRREIADEIGEIRAQQRLAAGDAHLLHAGAHEHARQAQDLREVEPLAGFQEAVRLVKGLARHAIRAAEIAAVHDRDAQVVDGPPQRVHAARGRLGRAASGMTFSRVSMVTALTSGRSAPRNPSETCWARAAARRSRRCRRAR